MKVTRHSLLAKGIMVLLSLLVLIFAFTYSWFVDVNAPVTATGFSVAIDSPNKEFEYAIGFSTSQTGGQYKHTKFTDVVDADLNLEELYTSDDTNEEHPINLLYDYTPTDLTGNGVTLIRPSMNYGNWSINTASRNYSIAEENVQYVSFDLIFRTKATNTTIRLDSDSYAKGACETYAGDGSLLTDTASRNKDNKYGAFSTDAVVGAVRVAFLEYVNNGESADTIIGTKMNSYMSTPKLLWIPRPDLYLNNNPTGSLLHEKDTEGWALDTNVASNTTYSLDSNSQDNPSYSTYIHQYYNVFELGQNETPAITTYNAAVASVLDTSASGNKVTFGTTQDLITLSHINDENHNGEPDDQYYYGKVRVRIWIEGTDSESRRALAGGKFSVSLHITG